MATMGQTKATPHPDVICTELNNGEAVLLHLGTQTYFTLNETGAQIWKLMAAELDLNTIGQALEVRYTVKADQALQSVIALVDELADQKLVTLSCP